MFNKNENKNEPMDQLQREKLRKNKETDLQTRAKKENERNNTDLQYEDETN